MPEYENPVDYFSQMQASEGWRQILESFARFVNPDAGSLILDVGCGPGALVMLLREGFAVRVFGVDADPNMPIVAAKAHQQAIFTAGCLPVMPFAADTFDVVTATNVIYLLDDPSAGIREIARIIKPGGLLVMLNPSEKMSIAAATALADERGLQGFPRENFIHWGEVAESQYRWTESDVADLFAQAGLTLTETRTRVGAGLARYARGIKGIGYSTL